MSSGGHRPNDAADAPRLRASLRKAGSLT